MSFHPYSIPVLLSAVVLGILGWYSRRFRLAPAALPFRMLLWTAALYALAYALYICAIDPPLKIFFWNLAFVPGGCFPPIAFILAMEYTGEGFRLTRWRLAALWIVPLITAL